MESAAPKAAAGEEPSAGEEPAALEPAAGEEPAAGMEPAALDPAAGEEPAAPTKVPLCRAAPAYPHIGGSPTAPSHQPRRAWRYTRGVLCGACR